MSTIYRYKSELEDMNSMSESQQRSLINGRSSRLRVVVGLEGQQQQQQQRQRTKRQIHTATLRVNTSTSQVSVVSMAGHLRKNQRMAFAIEFDTNAYDSRLVEVRSRIRDFRMRNNAAHVRGSQVFLDDVRFLDSTHRSAKMDLVIRVVDSSSAALLAEYVLAKAIKITADGPRNRASKSKKAFKAGQSSKVTTSTCLESPPISPQTNGASSPATSAWSSSSASSSPSSPSSPISLAESESSSIMSSAPSSPSSSLSSMDTTSSSSFSSASSSSSSSSLDALIIQQSQIRLFSWLNEYVRNFELILNADNEARNEPLPQAEIDQIVQKFSQLLFQQYFQ